MKAPLRNVVGPAGSSPGTNPWRLSLILLSRDWRAGELRLLLVALAVAVAAVSTVGFFIDRLGNALTNQATQLLGGDVVVSADQPIPPQWIDEAQRRGLASAQTVNFPSMALAVADKPDTLAASQLASVKAVSDGYPLRGGLTVTVPAGSGDASQEAQEVVLNQAPEPGTVWVDRALLQALDLSLGQQLQLGDKSLRIERLILVEPDRGTSFINFAPRAMLSLQDLPATGLIQPGSRVSYRLLVSGERATVSAFGNWVKSRLRAGQRMETLEEGRPELRMTLDRSQQFLALVSLLSALIAAVAIGLAARRFAERHLDGFAVLKSLGARQRLLVQVAAARDAVVVSGRSCRWARWSVGPHIGRCSALPRR